MKFIFSIYWCLLIVPPLYSIGQSELKVGTVAPTILFSKSYPLNYTVPIKKPILLDFWATWCGPCIAGLIESDHLVKKYSKSLEFIAITDYTSRKVSEFIKAKNFNYNFIIDQDTLTTTAFGVSNIPMAFLIDTNNVIQWAGYSRYIDEDMIKEFISIGEVKSRVFKQAFDIKRFDTIKANSIEYLLVVSNKNKLQRHKTILVGKSDDEKGAYSNAPWAEGVLTVINYDLKKFTETATEYFKYLKLKCSIKDLEGYDFIQIPFDNFEKMNRTLDEEYGISFKVVK